MIEWNYFPQGAPDASVHPILLIETNEGLQSLASFNDVQQVFYIANTNTSMYPRDIYRWVVVTKPGEKDRHEPQDFETCFAREFKVSHISNHELSLTLNITYKGISVIKPDVRYRLVHKMFVDDEWADVEYLFKVNSASPKAFGSGNICYLQAHIIRMTRIYTGEE